MSAVLNRLNPFKSSSSSPSPEPAAAAPAASDAPATQDAALRAQKDGQRATGDGVSDSANETDLLGFTVRPKRKGAARATLG